MKTTMKKFLSVLLTVVMLCGIAPVSLFAQAADETPTVQIVSFMRGAQTDLRSSELLEAHVEGYDGNVQELTYKWTNTLGTYLYVYNSHNMYSINNTDGEVEIYNSKVSSSANMSGRSYKDSFTGKGYAWAAVYGANIGRTSLQGTVTVEVLDAKGNVLCSDSHTGTGTNNNRKGFVAYSLDADMDNVVLGLFEGDKRNVKDLLGESAVVHITCVESFVENGKITSGSDHIKLTKENGDYYITGTNAGTSTDKNGDAQVDLDISKGNCKFHNETSGDAITTVFVFKKPTTATTTTTLTLTGNLDDRCDYFIGGKEGVKQADGTIIFTGLTPNTAYTVEVRGEYIDKNDETKYAYAYVYDTTKPVYLASVYTHLDGALTDIGEIHGEDVELYLLEKSEDAELEDANFIALTHSATGTYTATVENGIYYPWHDDGPEYHLAREYKLVIEHANGDLHLHHYSVTYDTNGGAFKTNEDPGKEIFSSATAVNATKNIPVRDGYVFAGWKYGENTYSPDATVTQSISSPITLTAQWEKEVNVTINVTIDHQADGGHDQSIDKDNLVVNFLERKKGSDAYLETGDKLIFSASGVTDENGNSKAYNRIPTYCSEHTDQSVFTKYVANDATYTGLLESSTFGVAVSKSGYDVGVIEKIKDENGNWTINIPLTYNPDDFDLEFSVKMADDVPTELYPEAVIIKVKAWSEKDNQWNIITQQEGNKPGVRVDIDKTTGEGSGSYPVWKYNPKDATPYGYRAVIYAYVYDDATITVPEKNLNGTTVTYSDGNFTGTMGDIADGKIFGTILNGAYYDAATYSQTGTLDAVITVEKYNVTFDAQGGKVNGNDAQTVTGQYYVPEFDAYQPVMEEHNFLGWYLDKECTNPATEGVLLVEDITLYAKWDRVLTGTLIVDGYYTDSNGNQYIVDNMDRATHALIELEEITPDGTYNIDGKVVEINWTPDEHFSAPVSYMFKGLDPDKTYRIDVYILNYDALYQNSTTVINGNDDIHDDYNADDYTAVYPETSRNRTFVNTFLHFEPELYFQPVEVDASRIGEGFRPENTLVEYMGKETGTDNEMRIITQHEVYPYGIPVGMNSDGYNDGVYGYEVWQEVLNGKLYDYQANLTKIDGTDVASWPVIVRYGDPARYSPLNDAPTDTLKVTIIPMWYNIIYDLNTADDDSDRETVFSGHIWSYESVLDYTPVRDGYVFGGWYSDEDCTDGNEVTKVDAAVHEDTLVFAKWEKRSDLELTVNYVDKNTNETLETETKISQVFGDVITAESLKKDFTGYTFDSASADSVTITTGTNELTLYYTINTYDYTVNFLEQGTDKVLATAKNGTAVYNQTVTENAVAIDGYNLVGENSQSIVIDTENNVINFYYAKRTDLVFTVNYVDKNTNETLETGTKTSQVFGDVITAESLKKDFTGYTFDSASADSVTITTGTNEITLYYTINTYDYTVNFLEQGTDKVLATAKNGTAVYNQTVTENAVAIDGYNLVGENSQSIVIDTENNVINFYYAKRTDLVFTVNYVDKNTNEKLETETKISQVFGDVITAESLKKDFTGYTFDSASADSVTITTGTNELTLYYTINTYDYTVNFLEQGTDKVLATAKNGTAVYNQTVTENAVAIDGYNLVGENSQSIVIDTENNVINFYYAKRTDLVFTVNYVDKNTNETLETGTKTSQVFGDVITAESLKKDFTGYTFDSASADSVTITTGTNEITLYYTINTYDYTVNFLEQGTDKVLATAKNGTAVYNQTVTENAVAIDGYNLVGENSQSIVIDTENNVINFYYAKRNDLTMTVSYVEKATGKKLLADKTVSNLVFGETVDIASLVEDIAGYEYIESVPSEVTVDLNGNAVTLYYEKAMFGYTVEYYYDNVLDSSKTESMTALYQSVITSYPYKGTGYILGSVGNLPLTVGADEAKNVIRVYYYTDKVGGGEFGTTPDSNPDIYQKQVIFRVVNGTWADGTTRTIVKYVNLKTGGRWDVNGTATITAPAGMIAYEGYHNGAWNTTPPTTVKGTKTETYVFTFKAINEPEVPETPDVPENPDIPVIPGTPGVGMHIVFGKTEGIGWYRVSRDGGKTYEIVFGNSTFEVDYGEELIISVGDMPLDFDSYAFFVNEMLVPTDENGNLVITVKGYMLIRAVGYTKLPVPDTDDKNESGNNNSSDNTEDEKPLNFFQRIIKAIREFFERLFGIKK